MAIGAGPGLNIPTVGVNDAKELLKTLLANELCPPIFLWGPPGIGKSSIVAQAVIELGWIDANGQPRLKDVRALTLSNVDLRGVPVPETRTYLRRPVMIARWTRPDFLPPLEWGHLDCVLLFDELPNAPPLIQGALYQAVLDKKIGEHVLGTKVRIVACGNRPEDITGAMPILSALANRFIHIELKPDIETWIKEWAEQPIDPKRPELGQRINPLIIDFVRWCVNNNIQVFETPKPGVLAYSTPRSIEFFSRNFNTLMDALEERLKEPDLSEVEKQKIKTTFEEWVKVVALATLGEHVGSQFNSFLRYYRLLPSNIMDVVTQKKLFFRIDGMDEEKVKEIYMSLLEKYEQKDLAGAEKIMSKHRNIITTTNILHDIIVSLIAEHVRRVVRTATTPEVWHAVVDEVVDFLFYLDDNKLREKAVVLLRGILLIDAVSDYLTRINKELGKKVSDRFREVVVPILVEREKKKARKSERHAWKYTGGV